MALARDNFTHEEIINELEKYQDKIMPALADLKERGQMPEEMLKPYEAIVADDATLDSYMDLSRALGLYMGLFPESAQEHIAEYRELVHTLFQMDEGLETPNAYDPLKN